jgi:hypothetical protein
MLALTINEKKDMFSDMLTGINTLSFCEENQTYGSSLSFSEYGNLMGANLSEWIHAKLTLALARINPLRHTD